MLARRNAPRVAMAGSVFAVAVAATLLAVSGQSNWALAWLVVLSAGAVATSLHARWQLDAITKKFLPMAEERASRSASRDDVARAEEVARLSVKQAEESAQSILSAIEEEATDRGARDAARDRHLEEVMKEISSVCAELAQASARDRSSLVDALGRLDKLASMTDIIRAAVTELRELSSAISELSAGAADLGAAVDVIAESALPELAAKVDAGLKSSRAEFERTKRRNIAMSNQLRIISTEPASQVQALLQLRDKTRSVFPSMPLLSGWALDPSTMRVIVDHIESVRPRVVLECGSGSSTVWTAGALKSAAAGSLISLEHDSDYVALARDRLAELGLSERVQVLHAPLRKWQLGGTTMDWYILDDLEVGAGIDLLIVDGPPERTGPMARYPALPLLRDRLKPGALILLDDARRSDERATVQRWKEEGLIAPEVQALHSAVLLRAT